MHPKIENKFTEIQQLNEDLFDYLKEEDHEILQKKPGENTWSIGQVLGHLIMSEKSSILYCQKKIKAGDQLPETGIRTLWRMFLLERAFNGNRKFKAPSYVASPENLTLEAAEEKWKKVRQQLYEFLERYPDKYLKKAIFKHPFAGRISIIQMMDFFSIHQRHHRKQMKNIIENH